MSESVTIYHAGSLRGAFGALARIFEQANPGIAVRLVAGGSVDLARRIKAGELADIFASADHRLIEEFPQGLVLPATPFARNRMVLLHRPGASGSDEVGPDNWPEILLRPDVRFAIADPDEDPGGYRSLMVWQLAEIHYARPGLFRALLEAPGRLTYSGEKTLRFYDDFSAGIFDYAIAYASSAIQNRLIKVDLSSEIDLSDPTKSATYAAARVKTRGLDGEIERTAEPILFGITIVRSSPNFSLGQAFIELLISGQGKEVLQGAGFTLVGN